MEPLKKISDELSATGQLSLEALQHLADQGFQSVVNLRSPDEIGFLPDELAQSEKAGLHYANIPLSPDKADSELTNQVLAELENLPKPILIHCGAGARASALALIATAVKESWTPEQIAEKAQQLGIQLNQPHLTQFLAEKKAE